MAGHSQFKNIMHKKGKQDAIRSKLFSKLAREITVAAKLGLPDPAMNARLRVAMIAARAENMPKDNIERAIKKASSADTENLRRSALRGLCAGRRGGHRRGADRQPQPHRGRGALLFHQGRRVAGRNGRGLLHVRPRRTDRLRPQGRRRGRDAGGGDRGGRGRRRVRPGRARGRHLGRGAERGAKGARGEVRRAAEGLDCLAAAEHRSPSTTRRAKRSCASSARSRTTTTSRPSPRTSRSPRRYWRRWRASAALRAALIPGSVSNPAATAPRAPPAMPAGCEAVSGAVAPAVPSASPAPAVPAAVPSPAAMPAPATVPAAMPTAMPPDRLNVCAGDGLSREKARRA